MTIPIDLINRYFDCQLEQGEFEQLEAWINSSDENTAEFLRYSALHEQLRCYLCEPLNVPETLLVDEEESPSSESPSCEPGAAASGDGVIRTNRLPRVVLQWLHEAIRWDIHPVRFASVTLAATAIAWVVLLLNVLPIYWNKGVAEVPQPLDLPIVAQFIDETDAIWNCEPKEIPALGTSLRQGKVLALKSGFIQIRFKSRAVVTIEGPANFSLSGENAGSLDVGKLTADVPTVAHGFAVASPNAIFVDRGTRFGVEVDPKGKTTMQVFQGLVEVRQDSGEKYTLATGESVQVDKKGAIVRRPFNRKRFASEKFEVEMAPAPDITRLSGDIQLVKAMPRALAMNTFQNSSHIVLFCEQKGVTLPEAVSVDIVAPGTGDITCHAPGSVPSGKRVDSYLLHFDPSEDKHYSGADLSGQITFDRQVLGIIATTPGFDRTDDFLGVRGIRYGDEPSRGIEVPARQVKNDIVTLSADRCTVRVKCRATNGYDQLRVLVSARPERSSPGS